MAKAIVVKLGAYQRSLLTHTVQYGLRVKKVDVPGLGKVGIDKGDIRALMNLLPSLWNMQGEVEVDFAQAGGLQCALRLALGTGELENVPKHLARDGKWYTGGQIGTALFEAMHDVRWLANMEEKPERVDVFTELEPDGSVDLRELPYENY